MVGGRRGPRAFGVALACTPTFARSRARARRKSSRCCAPPRPATESTDVHNRLGARHSKTLAFDPPRLACSAPTTSLARGAHTPCASAGGGAREGREEPRVRALGGLLPRERPVMEKAVEAAGAAALGGHQFHQARDKVGCRSGGRRHDASVSCDRLISVVSTVGNPLTWCRCPPFVCVCDCVIVCVCVCVGGGRAGTRRALTRTPRTPACGTLCSRLGGSWPRARCASFALRPRWRGVTRTSRAQSLTLDFSIGRLVAAERKVSFEFDRSAALAGARANPSVRPATGTGSMRSTRGAALVARASAEALGTLPEEPVRAARV